MFYSAPPHQAFCDPDTKPIVLPNFPSAQLRRTCAAVTDAFPLLLLLLLLLFDDDDDDDDDVVMMAATGTFCLSHRSYVAHGCASSGGKDFKALVCPLCKKTVRFNGSQDPNEQ